MSTLGHRLGAALGSARARLVRGALTARLARRHDLKLHYGCGEARQQGYVNVDVRWTPAVDFIADLEWCSRRLAGCCAEVYLSHVLEHYRSPGKAMRDGPDTVLGALKAIRRLLVAGGIVRIAVPDFGALARLYVSGRLPLHPQVLGRLCGEQDYPQNVHRCAFDRPFLEHCLSLAGFGAPEAWLPDETAFARDSSFDSLDGDRTSLNLTARRMD